MQPAKQSKTSRAFVSYRRVDSADAVGRICDHLRVRLGEHSVFKDVDNVPVGTDFRAVIGDAILYSELFVAVIGPDWLGTDKSGSRRIDDPSDHVRIEVESALRWNVTIIPVLVRGAEMPSANDLPESLRELAFLNALRVRPDPDFFGDLSRLIEKLTEGRRLASAASRQRWIEFVSPSTEVSWGLFVVILVMVLYFGTIFGLPELNRDPNVVKVRNWCLAALALLAAIGVIGYFLPRIFRK